MRVHIGILATVTSCWLGFFPLPTYSQSPSVTDPDSLFFRALRLQRSGNLEESTRLYSLLLRSYPEYHDARIQLARILASDGRYQEALLQIDSVLFAQPSSIEGRFAKAQILGWTGRYRQSVDILLSLTDETPGSARFLMELGNVYFRGGAQRKALEYFEQAYVIAPSDRDVFRSLARTHRSLGNDDLTLYWYRKLLASSPGDPESRREILRVLYKANNEIQLGASYEAFRNTAIPVHSLIEGAYYVVLNENWKPFMYFGRLSKFSATENRFGAGAYATLDPSVGLFIQFLVSPSATVAPDFDATAEMNAGVSSGLELIGGYRYMRFDSLSVNIAMPGVSLYINDDTWLTARGYFGLVPLQPVSTSGTLTLFFRATEMSILRLGVFSGYELFRATSFSEIASLRSSGVLLGFKIRVNPYLALDGQYLYTSRNLLSASHLLTATVSVLF